MNEFFITIWLVIIIVSISLWNKYKNDEILVKSLEESYESIKGLNSWLTAAELSLELYEIAHELKPKLLFINHIERVKSLQEKAKISMEAQILAFWRDRINSST